MKKINWRIVIIVTVFGVISLGLIRMTRVSGHFKGDLVVFHLDSGERVCGKIDYVGLVDIDVKEYTAVYHPNIFYQSLGEWKVENLNKIITIPRWNIVGVEEIKAKVDSD